MAQVAGLIELFSGQSGLEKKDGQLRNASPVQ